MHKRFIIPVKIKYQPISCEPMELGYLLFGWLTWWDAQFFDAQTDYIQLFWFYHLVSLLFRRTIFYFFRNLFPLIHCKCRDLKWLKWRYRLVFHNTWKHTSCHHHWWIHCYVHHRRTWWLRLVNYLRCWIHFVWWV